MATARYIVGVYDRAGEYVTCATDTYPSAREIEAIFRSQYPDKTVLISNSERDGRVVPDDPCDTCGEPLDDEGGCRACVREAMGWRHPQARRS